jgi:hypothetical protein
MDRRELSRTILRVSGIVLILLGAVHLLATPEMPHLLDGLPANARAFAVGPTVLNHVLVGILLMPLGFSTWLAASKFNFGQPWARQAVVVNSLAVLALPLSLVLFMRQAQYYSSWLFLAGVTLAALTAALFAVAAWVSASTRP